MLSGNQTGTKLLFFLSRGMSQDAGKEEPTSSISFAVLPVLVYVWKACGLLL